MTRMCTVCRKPFEPTRADDRRRNCSECRRDYAAPTSGRTLGDVLDRYTARTELLKEALERISAELEVDKMRAGLVSASKLALAIRMEEELAKGL